MRSISFLRSVSEGGSGDFAMGALIGGPEVEIKHGFRHSRGALGPSSPASWREDAGGLSLFEIRGHLSRPACSHVKQFAKQAGDIWIPAEPLFRPGFLWPAIERSMRPWRGRSGM